MLTTPLGPPNPNRQPVTGLVALSVNGLDQGVREGAWEGGFSFDSETCDDGLLYSSVCQVTTEKDTDPDLPGITTYVPVTLAGFDQCSTMDPGRDSEARARRHLLSVQSHQLEVAFETGEATDDATANGGDRPHLADSTATELTGGTDPVVALALLDSALNDCLHGVAGMVHMTSFALARFVEKGAVFREQNRWWTPNGHSVVAGSGYTGVGPRADVGQALPAAPALGADQWAYGTPMVTTLLGPVDVHSVVDRTVNTRTVLAERSGAAFHGGCCKFAIQLDFTP